MKAYLLEGSRQIPNDWPDAFGNLRKGAKPHCGPCRNPLTCGCQYTISAEQMQQLAKEQGYVE